jgi:hypothetical protein
MSGEHQSTGRIRAACAAELDDKAIEEIASQAMLVAGLGAGPCEPRALAVALGYKTAWSPRLPNDVTSMVVGRTIYYANHPSDAEMSRRVALPLAHLILEAWGYDLGATTRLSLKLAV